MYGAIGKQLTGKIVKKFFFHRYMKITYF